MKKPKGELLPNTCGTPACIGVLMLVYCNSAPLPVSPITDKHVTKLLAAGLIESSGLDRPLRCWKTTERGRAHATALCDLPFPIKLEQWVHPLTLKPIIKTHK